MVYQIKFKDKAKKIFNNLDNSIKLRITKYLEKVANSENPKTFGKGLEDNLVNLWSYRVGKYRIVAEIKDKELIIYIVSVGKRETIYDKTDKRLNK